MSKTKYHFVSNTGQHTVAAAGGGGGGGGGQVAEREQADERAAQPQRSESRQQQHAVMRRHSPALWTSAAAFLSISLSMVVNSAGRVSITCANSL